MQFVCLKDIGFGIMLRYYKVLLERWGWISNTKGFVAKKMHIFFNMGKAPYRIAFGKVLVTECFVLLVQQSGRCRNQESLFYRPRNFQCFGNLNPLLCTGWAVILNAVPSNLLQHVAALLVCISLF